jgi:sideroflexin-1/3
MIETKDGKEVGLSTNAAISAISQVIPSRIGMAVPGMMIPPIAMSFLEKTPSFMKNPWLKAPATVREKSHDFMILTQLYILYYLP